MAKVTLYEYDGEDICDDRRRVMWKPVGEPVEYYRDECTFDEALEYGGPLDGKSQVLWVGPWRNADGLKVYEAEAINDRPLYRAEVEE